jgi:mRNA interferase MazF
MEKLFMVRGQVWLINLESTLGAEIKKTRPAVIVNDDADGILPLKVIVPITKPENRRAGEPENRRNSYVTDSPIRPFSDSRIVNLSQARFVRQLGKLSEVVMQEITKALSVVLAIE